MAVSIKTRERASIAETLPYPSLCSGVLDKLMSIIFCRRSLAARSFFEMVAIAADAVDPMIKLSEPPLPL